MPYIGKDTSSFAVFKQLDDISASFNGVLTNFPIRYLGDAIQVVKPEQLTISLGGVTQSPNSSYTIGGVGNDTIIFSEAPAAGVPFWGVLLGGYYNLQVNEVDTLTVATTATVPTILGSSVGNLAASTKWVQENHSVPYFKLKRPSLTGTLTHNTNYYPDLSTGTLTQSPNTLTGLSLANTGIITIPAAYYGLWLFRAIVEITPPNSTVTSNVQLFLDFYNTGTTSWERIDRETRTITSTTANTQLYTLENTATHLVNATGSMIRVGILQTNTGSSNATISAYEVRGVRLSAGIY